jgi:hypothetical protein
MDWNPNDPLNTREFYVTNPVHGGKETCHKCNGFIKRGEHLIFTNCGGDQEFDVNFHRDCFNPYEHYYGLDRPID